MIQQTYFAVFIILKTMLNCCVISSDALKDVSDHHVETIKDYEDHILVRSRRSDNADLCMYEKGQWSPCNKELDIISREDLLEPKLSSSTCNPTRTLYRKCNERTSKTTKDTTCVFEKPKTVPWTGCLQDVGLNQKVLHLVSAEGAADCPKQKLISRKCGENKKQKKNKKKKGERKTGKKKENEQNTKNSKKDEPNLKKDQLNLEKDQTNSKNEEEKDNKKSKKA